MSQWELYRSYENKYTESQQQSQQLGEKVFYFCKEVWGAQYSIQCSPLATQNGSSCKVLKHLLQDSGGLFFFGETEVTVI